MYQTLKNSLAGLGIVQSVKCLAREHLRPEYDIQNQCKHDGIVVDSFKRITGKAETKGSLGLITQLPESM